MSSKTDKLETVLTRKADRIQRRERVIEMISRGASPTIVAKALGLSMRRVYYILNSIKKVGARRLKARDMFETVHEAIEGYRQIAKQAYQNFAQSDSEAMQARWLKLALEARDSMNKIQQSMGLMPTAAQEINITGNLGIEWFGDAKTSAAELMAELRGVGNLTN